MINYYNKGRGVHLRRGPNTGVGGGTLFSKDIFASYVRRLTFVAKTNNIFKKEKQIMYRNIRM